MDQSDAPDLAERLFEELRLAVAEETVPPEVVAAAKAVYSWRTIDAELAELLERRDEFERTALIIAAAAGAGRASWRGLKPGVKLSSALWQRRHSARL